MVTQAEAKVVSLAEFQEFVNEPENSDKLFELINGEIIVVSPGRTSNSELGGLITVAVHIFCREHKLPCHTSGGDGAYQIGEDVVAPDFAYKHAEMSDEYPDPVPPEWVVEIISPTDKAADIRDKRQIYIEAKILYWEMYPKAQSVDVYAPGKAMRTVKIDETLDGGDVLPGFTLALRELFARER